MPPVSLSTSSQRPRCHCHFGAASSGRASFTRSTRRTTNSRSANLLRRSQHVLPDSAIYHQRTDLDAHLLVVSVRTDHPLHRHPLSEGDDVRFGGSECREGEKKRHKYG